MVIVASAFLVYFILLIILILNMEDKSQVIKYSFITFVISLFLLTFFSNDLIMDYLISLVIRYWYFPTFASIILTILITMVVFVKNIYRDKILDKKRIINYIFASYILIGYILFMLENIDINSYNQLYSGNSLLLVRYIARSFVLWGVVNLCIKYCFYFKKR